MNRIIKSITVCASLVLFTASSYAEVKREFPKSRDEKREEDLGSMLGSEGLHFSPAKIGKTSTSSQAMAINNYLWRASLEALSSMPLASSDSMGGVIVTDWYSAKASSNSKFKIVVTISGTTIDPTNLSVKLYKRKKVKGEWVDIEDNNNALAISIEEKILVRARQLFVKESGGK